MDWSQLIIFIWSFVKVILYLAAPFVLLSWVCDAFMDTHKASTMSKRKHELFEIKVPKTSIKTPLAMEVLLSSMWQPSGESNIWDTVWGGKSLAFFSLEIAMVDGVVHFYVWTQEKFAKIIEQQVYAQYPGATVSKVDDYTKMINFESSGKRLMSYEYFLSKRNCVYPIKTYLDFNLQDEKVDSELRTDPLNFLLEAIKGDKGEQLWIQFVMQAHKSNHPVWRKFGAFELFPRLKKRISWEEEGTKEIAKIRSKMINNADKLTENVSILSTKGDNEKIAAIEHKASKIVFDVGIRSLYIADKDKYNKSISSVLKSLFKPYDSLQFDYLRPRKITDTDMPWELIPFYKQIVLSYLDLQQFVAFQKRSFFHLPRKSNNVSILNVEELATLFHFPGQDSEVAAVEKIMSKHAEPPGNLPV